MTDVRWITRELGFGLTTRVRVVFGNIDPPGGGSRHVASMALAHTKMLPTGPRTADVSIIQVRRGLPAFAFGRAVAHEVGHAWLAQGGALPHRPKVEEGVCELVAYAWLKRSNVPFAELVRDSLKTNPDPTYSTGFREVHAAIRHHGLTAVIASLTARGELPRAPQPTRESR